MIAWSRIDSRLIHGQVIEAWLPHLKVQRVVVADGDVVTDPLAKAAYALAMPAEVELVLAPVAKLDFASLDRDKVRTLVLFRDVKAAVAARERGLPDGMLNLGNIHTGPGREQVSRSIFLDAADTQSLEQLSHSGMRVRIQAVPTDPESPIPSPPTGERVRERG